MTMRLPIVTRLALGASLLVASLTACAGYQPINAVHVASHPVGPQGIEDHRPMIAVDGAKSVLPQGDPMPSGPVG